MRRLLQVASVVLPAMLAVVLIEAAAGAGPQSDNQPRPKDNPIPNTFVNLQVLPRDISKHDLVGMMKQFSITFAVRCSYCHEVSDDLTEGRFDSDAKPTKEKARELMKTLLSIGKPPGKVEPVTPIQLRRFYRLL